MSNPTCTIVVSATGERCGEPAVHTFGSSTNPGEILGECEAHHMRLGGGDTIGDLVEVHRHGKTYVGQIVRVTPSRRWASVTYGNGRERVVEV